MRCEAEPAVTLALRYAEREVVIDELVADRDPNLLDLCEEHVGRLRPPMGWTVHDARQTASVLRG